MIVDGKAIAREMRAALAERRAKIGGEITLGIILFPGDPVIESFVRIKQRFADELGVRIVRREIEATTESAIEAVRALKFDDSVDAFIVQLPLPADIDSNAVLAEIPNEKDVDGINPQIGERYRIAHSPVALAVREILAHAGVDPRGKRAVVVGAGRLVGAPAAMMLESAGAVVSRFTLNEGKIEDLKYADIVVAGAGEPHMIKPEHLKQGVALIDAGTSEIAGSIQGDADPACAEISSVFTPVPGGVGPVAVHMIFSNLFDLVELRNQQTDAQKTAK